MRKPAPISDKIKKRKVKITTHRPNTLCFYGDDFVLNTASGMFYRVTATARDLLRALDTGAEEDDLVDLIQSRYEVDRTTAIRDVELLLNELSALGILDRYNLR